MFLSFFLHNLILRSKEYWIIPFTILLWKFQEKANFNKLYHSSDIDFKNVMNLYKIFTAKPYPFLAIDDNLLSDNISRFRKNILERV